MEPSLATYASVTLLACLKFYVGLVVALAHGFSLGEVMCTACAGALCGVWVSTYFGEALRTWLARLWPWQSDGQRMPQRPRLLRVWRTYGLTGLALLLPVLSPQVCIVIALALQEQRQRIVLYMSASVVWWSFVCTLCRDLILQVMKA